MNILKIKPKQYYRVEHLFESKNELSVFSVLSGNMPGQVYVDDEDNPTSVMVKTSEANVLAGSVDNSEFNDSIKEVIGFWECLTPDSNTWLKKIPEVHDNNYIKEYTRRRYLLREDQFIRCSGFLPDGYVLETIDFDKLRENNYVNTSEIFSWFEPWGSEENFMKDGCGCFIRNNKEIVSWSLTDFSYKENVATGIITSNKHRKKGFGIITASANITACFEKGYKVIEWSCVDKNLGSRAIAEKLGFVLENKYSCFSSFPPIENLHDLTNEEWVEWGDYLEVVLDKEPRLHWECVHCYIKGNSVKKAICICECMRKNDMDINVEQLCKNISYFQGMGLSLAFIDREWTNYINKIKR